MGRQSVAGLDAEREPLDRISGASLWSGAFTSMPADLEVQRGRQRLPEVVKMLAPSTVGTSSRSKWTQCPSPAQLAG
jgi:hypothetical protein